MVEKCKKLNTGCPYIDGYLNQILSGKIPASKEMHQACDLIDKKLSVSGVVIDTVKIEKAKELIERYFEMTLLPWEMLVLSLVHCYEPDGTLVFTEFLIMMGRGDGKNGFISGLAWYLTTKYHGIRGYNVDIVANSEEQAKTSFTDVYDMLSRTWAKSKRFFYKSLELIKNLNTESYIKYNTSGAKTKDGRRSACLIFDEIHEYEDGKVMRTFRSGFGKRKNSRVFYITTNGYVRDGILDQKLEIAHRILNGEVPTSRMCPLLYKMDSEDEVRDKSLWVKACPSLPYFDSLRIEMEQEFLEMAYDNEVKLDFYTKRMNLPRSDHEIAVTDWSNIAATNNQLPDMNGWQCTVGIDYASMRDWAAVDFHFKNGEMRYDISYSWICLKNPDLARIKAPWRDWADAGLLTPVDSVEIDPVLLTDYIQSVGQKYFIRRIALDNFRFALMRQALAKIGFDPDVRKNVTLVRPSDIMRVQPIVGSCFNKHLFTWGDCPPLRWATNNTKLVRAGKKEGTDTGNFYYAKIEAKSRKTDPFMALVAAMTVEDEIQPPIPDGLPVLRVIVG